MANVPPQLLDAADHILKSHTTKVLRVKELLSWFQAQRRGVQVVREIRSALKSTKLVTVPDFEVAYIDQRITLKAQQTERKNRRASKKPVRDERPSGTHSFGAGVFGGSALDPAQRIGMVEAANSPPTSVALNAILTEATSQMVTDNYSQLPVMHGERTALGFVSWTSIGRATVTSANDCKYVSDCIDEDFEVVRSEDHIFEAIRKMGERDAVLVKNKQEKVVGIVTAYDINRHLCDLAEPFLLLREIEYFLRRLIEREYSLDELRANRDSIERTGKTTEDKRKINFVTDLSFGDYVRLLEKKANWDRLPFNSLSRTECTKRLKDVGRIRNDVMHFRPDEITNKDLNRLRGTRKFLQQLETNYGRSQRRGRSQP